MYEDCETQVLARVGNTEYFNVKVGLHQGSAISPLLFIIIMDVLSSEIDKEHPWAMLFADKLVLCETSKAAGERERERERERTGDMARPIRKTRTESQPDKNSVQDSDGGAERDINNPVKLAWMKWKQLTGVLCDKTVPIKLKDKVYNMVIKPTMTFGAECWAVRKKDENRLHTAEMRMLRWIRGNTRKDHVSNQLIQEDGKVCQMSTFLR